MACPFFAPKEPLAATESGVTGRWPLIEPWRGTCLAMDSEPSREVLLQWCNLGYARGACAHFPAAGEGDAIRFSMQRGARLHYVVERDHHPLAHGLADETNDATLLAQAEAFSKSWERCPQRIDE